MIWFIILLIPGLTSGDTCSCSTPNQYELLCCNPDNLGNIVRIDGNDNRQKYIICPSTLLTQCQLLSSCSNVLVRNPSASSGYYDVNLSNGSVITVYCDMDGNNCDGEGGWIRVAQLNMSEPGATCPPGLTLQNYSNIDHSLCGRSSSGCASTFFSTYGLNYTKVCGKVRGYQFGHIDAFNSGINNIDSFYVEGISITYSSNPRQHIWTYAGGYSEFSTDSLHCPCNSGSSAFVPDFVGNDYYCESGNRNNQFDILLVEDILWDGQQCNSIESTCCTNPNMPWFLKTLNEETNDDIELRDCASLSPTSEETPLDIIEIYIK